LVMDSRLSQVNWFDLHLSWGKGTILRAFCSSALWQICISPLGCRSAGLHLLRMQESQCPPWGMGHSLICLRSPDPTTGNRVKGQRQNMTLLKASGNRTM
jgi:hypothetical protein